MEAQKMSPIHSEGERPLKSRRSHTKSRKGCISCKQRKVKCDEAHPSCRRCELREQECVYPAGIPPRARPQKMGLTPAGPATFEVHTRHHPHERTSLLPYDATLPESRSSNNSSTEDEVYKFTMLFRRIPEASPMPPSPSDGNSGDLNLKDLALMHHFCVHTSTLAMNTYRHNCTSMLDAWQIGIPSIAVRNQCVMQATLALAALCTYLDETAKTDADPMVLTEYLHLAESHHDKSLNIMRDEVSAITANNMGVVLATSTLLASFTFAYGRVRQTPEPNVHWIQMCRGVNSLLDVARTDPVAFMASTQPLAAILQQTSGSDTRHIHGSPHSGRTNFAYKHPMYPTIKTTRMSALNRLRDLLESTNDELAPICVAALETLADVTSSLFSDTAFDDAPTRTILSWSCDISPVFVDLLRSGEPMALAVLAHMYVFVILLEDGWTIADMGKVEIGKISEMLGPAWERWLEWPQSMVIVSEEMKRFRPPSMGP